jgi:hypothetical protein
MEAWLTQLIASQDGASIISTFKSIIRSAVGQRSEDGKSFIKTDEYADWFLGTDAYAVLFMELVNDMEASTKFIAGIVPKDMGEKLAKMDVVELPQPGEKALDSDQDKRPAWLREDREPTPKEVRAMDKDELILAMQHRANKNTPQLGG